MERSISPDALKTQLTAVHVIDVRRKADRDASPDILPGATWRDPEQLAQWAGELPTGRPIVLYCVRGGSVSNSVVDALQARGLNARFIEGGIEGWKAVGGAVGPKPA
jgi:rhodanese-related sulfurtransferase